MARTPAYYAELAYEKLLVHGRTVSVTSYAESYNPATGTNTQTPTTYTGVVASPILSYEDKYINNDLIKLGDGYVIIPNYGLAFTPAIGQLLVADAVNWRILSAKPYTYQTGVVAYECQLRKV